MVELAEHCTGDVARHGVAIAMPVTHDAEQASVAYDAAVEDTFPLSD